MHLDGGADRSGTEIPWVDEPPETAAFVGLCASLVVSANAIFEIVRLAYVVPAGRFTLEDINPV